MSTTSFVVLGLVNECGEATAYELNALVDNAIGYFWEFPRSQIYAESVRLVEAGLLAEDREQTGRRRRVVSLTPEGQRELSAWLATPVDDPCEIRDLGLLKLFFSSGAPTDDVVELARHQLAAHSQRLAEYQTMAIYSQVAPAENPRRAVLGVGVAFEQMIVAFWQGILDRPPGT